VTSAVLAVSGDLRAASEERDKSDEADEGRSRGGGP
jgi:hypothetical protein